MLNRWELVGRKGQALLSGNGFPLLFFFFLLLFLIFMYFASSAFSCGIQTLSLEMWDLVP